MQFWESIVAWNETGAVVVPLAGTVAEQVRVHTGTVEMMMLPLWVHGVAPETVAV